VYAPRELQQHGGARYEVIESRTYNNRSTKQSTMGREAFWRVLRQLGCVIHELWYLGIIWEFLGVI